MAEPVSYSLADSAQNLCPTSGEVCPAVDTLIRLYSESVDARTEQALPDQLKPSLDGMKLALRLGEYQIAAQIINCLGPEDNSCPTRISMDNSRVRQGIVATIRKGLRLAGN